MNQLRQFLLIATRHLSQPMKTVRGEYGAQGGSPNRRSWCAWTTFGRLGVDAGYWKAELPLEAEIGETYVRDGGTWGQPFKYENDLAHIIIPREFDEEYSCGNEFRIWGHEQDIDGLSALLLAAGIEHRLSDYVLEIKLY